MLNTVTATLMECLNGFWKSPCIVINKPRLHVQILRFNMMNLTYYFWPFWYLLKWLITGWIAQLSFWIQYKSHCQSKPSIIPPVGVCISEGMKQNGDFVIFNYSRWLCLWLHYNIVAQFCLQWKKEAAPSHCFSLETLPGPHQRSPLPSATFLPHFFHNVPFSQYTAPDSSRTCLTNTPAKHSSWC